MNGEHVTEQVYTCGECLEEVESLNEVSMCEDCAVSCVDCGDTARLDELNEFAQCDDCRHECEDCNQSVEDSGDLYSINYDREVCLSCYEEYMTCEACDYTSQDSMNYSDRDGAYYCDDCYSDQSGDVHEYSYVPSPVFHGKGTKRFYGVELEIDDGDGDVASDLKELSDDENLFYLKEDGSLGSEGVEVVTHPATLKFHEQEMPWQKIINTARDHDYTSHDAGTCGMHVHVSRNSLGDTRRAQEQTIDKMLILIWKFWPELVKFSRRREHDMNWCNPAYTPSTIDPKFRKENLDVAKSKGKYAALNVSPRRTVEFRLFRGTLKRETLLASIQLFDVLIDMAMNHGISWAVRSSKWSDVLDQAAKRPALASYLASRQDADSNEQAA